MINTDHPNHKSQIDVRGFMVDIMKCQSNLPNSYQTDKHILLIEPTSVFNTLNQCT